jgi:hypothetical protein
VVVEVVDKVLLLQVDLAVVEPVVDQVQMEVLEQLTLVAVVAVPDVLLRLAVVVDQVLLL